MHNSRFLCYWSPTEHTIIAFPIHESDGDFSKAQVNTVEITEAPNSDSEEPQPIDSIDTSTQAPVHNPIILNYATYVIIYLCI